MAKKPAFDPYLRLPGTLMLDVPASTRMLETVLPGLMDDLAKLSHEMDEVRKGGGSLRMARAFVTLHRMKEVLDAINGATGGRFPALFESYKSDGVPPIFEAEGVGGSKTGGTGRTLSLAEGFRVTTSTKMQVSLRVENRQAGFEWLRKNDLGDLIVEQVNPATLSATAKVMLEEQGIELPEDIFTVNAKNTTSVTRTAKK